MLEQLKEERDVWTLAGNPLLLVLFCVLWNDPDQAKRSLPNTRSKLYKETIESLWKRSQCEANDEPQLKLMKFVENLGKVTLEGLLDPSKEKVLFSDGDFDDTTLSLALSVGILSKKKIKSNLRMDSYVEFLHTSFQDYCSAVYLANLHKTNNERCKQYVEKMFLWGFTLYTHWYNRMSDVLYFCAACKPETSELIVCQLFAAFVTYDRAVQGIAPENPELRCLLSTHSISVGEERNAQIWGSFNVTDKESVTITFLFKLPFEAQLTYEQCDSLVDIARQSGLSLHLNWKLGQTEKHVQYQLNLLQPVTDAKNGLFFSTLYSIQLVNTIEFPKFYSLIVSMLRYTKQLCLFWLSYKFIFAPNQVSDLSEMFEALAGLENLKRLTLLRDVHDVNTLGNVDIAKSLPQSLSPAKARAFSTIPCKYR